MAFFCRARARISATSRAAASGSSTLHGTGTKSLTLAARSTLIVLPDHARPAVRTDRPVPRGEDPPELLLDQAGDGGALREAVVAGDRLQHLQLLIGRGEGADLLGSRSACHI